MLNFISQQRSRHYSWFCRFLQYALLLVCALLPGCSPDASVQEKSIPSDSVPLLRAVQVDLDYVYDADLQQQQANLDLLVNRLKKLGVTTVFLQAFANHDGTGVVESLYFPNRFLPVRADLFAPAAQAIRRSGIEVYGWLPMLAFSLPGQCTDVYVHQDDGTGQPVISVQAPRRLSPFNKQARTVIEGIYRDFAAQAVVDGILFHDDGILSDFEDASAAALQAYANQGFPPDIKRIRSDRKIFKKWSRFKTRYLIDFSLQLLEIVRSYQPGIRSARNIFAGPVLHPESEAWFGQSLPLFLQAYDYTVLMAMPFMEQAVDPERWLEQLSWSALNQAADSNRIVFELQTKNWQTGKPIRADVLQGQIVLLAQMGVTSFAYYPDDFFNNMPPENMVRSCLTNSEYCSGGN